MCCRLTKEHENQQDKNVLPIDRRGFLTPLKEFSEGGKINSLHIKGIKVKAIDSPAAGDAFNVVLPCALAEGINIEEAVKFANCAGALAVTKTGAQSSLPVRREIEALMKKNSGSRRL